MYCPDCKVLNKCNCSNCNPNGETKGVIIVDKGNDKYICYFCGYKFDPNESLDYEWEQMKKDHLNRIDAELALKWLTISGFERKKLEKSLNLGEYAFSSVIFHRFNKRYDEIDSNDIQVIKRNIRIKSIINI